MKTISFATGSLGNVPILERILKQSLSEVEPRMLLSYANPLGLSGLRRQIAELHGYGLTEENVMITSSAQQALGIIFDYLASERKNNVLAQEPAYFGVLRILRKSPDMQVTPFDEFETIEDRIGSSSSWAIYLTSNFHNPTGRTMSLEEKETLAKKAKEGGLVIIEDNPYDFLYFGKERPSNVFKLAPKNAIYVSGFSKILGPGIRVGYIIADKNTIARLKSGKIDQDIFTSTLGQQVCAAALQQPKYLSELRQYFRNKRDLSLGCLDEYFGGEEGFRWNTPQGGIFILVRLIKGTPMHELERVAREKYKLILEKDKYTYCDGKSRNTTRINFVQNPDHLLREGIQRLYKAFEEVKNGA